MIKWLIKTWADKHICQMLDTTHRKCEVFWRNLKSWESHWKRGRVQKSIYRCYLLLLLARRAVFLLCEVMATLGWQWITQEISPSVRSRLYSQHVNVVFTYVNVTWSWRENAPFSNQPTCKSSPACCFFFILIGISLLTPVHGAVMVTWQSGFLQSFVTDADLRLPLEPAGDVNARLPRLTLLLQQRWHHILQQSNSDTNKAKKQDLRLHNGFVNNKPGDIPAAICRSARLGRWWHFTKWSLQKGLNQHSQLVPGKRRQRWSRLSVKSDHQWMNVSVQPGVVCIQLQLYLWLMLPSPAWTQRTRRHDRRLHVCSTVKGLAASVPEPAGSSALTQEMATLDLSHHSGCEEALLVFVSYSHLKPCLHCNVCQLAPKKRL